MDGLSLRVPILRISKPFQLAMPKKRATERIREVLEVDLTNAILSSGQSKGDTKHYYRHQRTHRILHFNTRYNMQVSNHEPRPRTGERLRLSIFLRSEERRVGRESMRSW